MPSLPYKSASLLHTSILPLDRGFALVLGVGSADYTLSPKVPSRQQSAPRRSMTTTKTVTKQISLKCLDCEREFPGSAEYKEQYIQDGSVLWKTVLNHVLDDCPYPDCRSHRVVPREEHLRS
jgi:hypothetical protein